MPRPTPRPSRTLAPPGTRDPRQGADDAVTTGPVSDAVERLQAGHRAIIALLARGPRALGPLTEALRRHAEEEQEVFHPALRRAAGREMAARVTESVRQHRVIERLLGDLGGLPTGPGRRQRFEELGARIEEHFRDTESSVFPEALRKLSRPERLALGERMDLLGQPR